MVPRSRRVVEPPTPDATSSDSRSCPDCGESHVCGGGMMSDGGNVGRGDMPAAMKADATVDDMGRQNTSLAAALRKQRMRGSGR